MCVCDDEFVIVHDGSRVKSVPFVEDVHTSYTINTGVCVPPYLIWLPLLL